jgi:hypothetical protein
VEDLEMSAAECELKRLHDELAQVHEMLIYANGTITNKDIVMVAYRAEVEQLREALDDLVDVIDRSTYGEEGIHHHTCPAPDHGKCTCSADAAMDNARAALEKK